MYNDAPTPQKMNRTDATSEPIAIPTVTVTGLSSPLQEPIKGHDHNNNGNASRVGDVYVQELTMDTIEQMRIIYNEGFGSKSCCNVFSWRDTNGSLQRFYSKNPKRLPMCGIAFGIEEGDNKSGDDGTTRTPPIPLGYVQLATYPTNDKEYLHTTKPGETYIEQVSVASAARGKGVGKVLLQWAEARAREQQSTVLTLSVLNGNVARRLYERYGFQAVTSNDECTECLVGCVVCCVVGRPYGMCDPHFGATDMKMKLLNDRRTSSSSSDDESGTGASIIEDVLENINIGDDDDDDGDDI